MTDIDRVFGFLYLMATHCSKCGCEGKPKPLCACPACAEWREALTR